MGSAHQPGTAWQAPPNRRQETAGAPSSCHAKAGEFRHAFALRARVHDRVAPIHGLRPVPRETHGDGPTHGRAFQIPHRGASQVVRDRVYVRDLRGALARVVVGLVGNRPAIARLLHRFSSLPRSMGPRTGTRACLLDSGTVFARVGLEERDRFVRSSCAAARLAKRRPNAHPSSMRTATTTVVLLALASSTIGLPRWSSASG
jgi:hypothetical protein